MIGELDDILLKEIEKMAYGIRKRALGLAIARGEGYLAQACSSAELFGVLYKAVLDLNPVAVPIMPGPFVSVPHAGSCITGLAYHGALAPEKDRFFLSATQYSVVLYCALVETRRMAEAGLDQFNLDGSSVEMIGAAHSPGMEVMSGSLGQTLSQAVGVALAKKLKRESGRVVVLMGDGECQSGQTWEAVQCISHYNLDNMLLLIDENGYQVDGSTKEVMRVDRLAERFRAFGMNTLEVEAHDIHSVFEACRPCGKPTAVVAHSDVCRGLDILRSRAPKFHFIRFADEREKQAFAAVYESMNHREI